MRKKKWILLFAFLMALLFGISAQASGKVSISAKKVLMTKGQKQTLQLYQFDDLGYGLSVKGTAVKWKSSKKSVVTVNKKGVLKARKNGKATITAAYRGKTYRCKVTVKPLRIVKEGDENFSFSGKLEKISYRHATGERMTGYELKLSTPIVVKSLEGNMITTDRIQLVLSNSQARKWKGKKVRVRGIWFQTFTSNWLYDFGMSTVDKIEKL